jgi:hypothetical protein
VTFPNGHYHATAAAQTICIGAISSDCNATGGLVGNLTSDPDKDGVVNSNDTCIGGSNPPVGFSGPAGQDTLTLAASAGQSTITVGSTAGFVNGSPILIGWASGSPVDGVAETLRYINAPPTATTITFTPALSGPHASGADVRQVSFAQTLRDLNNNGTVGVIDDIVYVSGRFGTQGGNPAGITGTPPNSNYVARADANNDSFIDVIGDLQRFAGVFSATCGPG